MENKKRESIWITILKILAIFFLFEVFTQVFGKVINRSLWQSIRYGKYAIYFVSEISVLILAIILLFIRKKWYIFKEKNTSLGKSLVIGGPIFVLSILFFVANSLGVITDLNNFNLANLISLVIFTVAVGLFEEVFFRGILQNELIEKHGDTRKGVILSITIASIVFGSAHITNVLYGQDLFTTIMQVFQTIAIGLVLGSTYYITKNIWAVVILHGFYDFALMLSDVFLYKDCGYVDNLPLNIKIASIGVSLVLVIVYLAYTYILLQKSKVNPFLNIEVTEEEKRKDKKNKELVIIIAAIAGAIIYMPSIIINAINLNKMDEYYICYDYDEITINNYETIYYNKSNFNIVIDNNNINFDIKDNKLIIKSGELEKNIQEDYIVKFVSHYDGYTYHLAYIKTDNVDYKVYYSSYLNDDTLYTSDLLDNLVSSFIAYDIPDATYLGILKNLENDEVYPFVKSTIDDIFVIVSDNIYVLE